MTNDDPMSPTPTAGTPLDGMNPWRVKGVGKLITATVVGNTIEYYDFTIYGTLTALVFAQLFFTGLPPFVGTLLAFGTFAVGFLSRPLGGIIFGALGDRFGRKPMLMWTLAIMGGATFLIGCLPTYQTIGFWAPLLLVLLRFIQGFGIGGEWGGAVTLMVEHAPKKRQGLYGSLVQSGSGLGIILAALTLVVLLASTTNQQLLSWGWRIPFLSAIILVAAGTFVRLYVEESPEFQKLQKLVARRPKRRSPLLQTVTRFPRTILLAFGMYAGVSAVGFLCGVFIINYAVNTLGFDKGLSVDANLVGACAYLVGIPLRGLVSDRIGRTRSYVIGLVAMMAAVTAMFTLMHTGSVPLYFLGLSLAEFTNGFVYGILAVLFANLFPAEVRYTGLSLSMQVSNTIAGGLMPVVAALLVNAAGGATTFLFIYVMALCAIAVPCTLIAPHVHEGRASVLDDRAPALVAE